MKRILYYDTNFRVGGYNSDLEVIGVDNLGRACELLENGKFDLIGINAGRNFALQFAEHIRDKTNYPVAILACLEYHFGYREAAVVSTIKKPQLVSVTPRSVKTRKNLGKLVNILNDLPLDEIEKN